MSSEAMDALLEQGFIRVTEQAAIAAAKIFLRVILTSLLSFRTRIDHAKSGGKASARLPPSDRRALTIF